MVLVVALLALGVGVLGSAVAAGDMVHTKIYIFTHFY